MAAASVGPPRKMAPKLQALSNRAWQLEKNFSILGSVLARAAQNRSTLAATLKVVVIILGTFVATRETFNLLFGTSNIINIMIFAIAGLLVAAVTGFETAFKWESRSAELRILAAACQTHRWELPPQQIRIEELDQVYASGSPPTTANEEKIAAVEEFVDALETKLAQLQEKAAALGINVAFEIENFERRRRS